MATATSTRRRVRYASLDEVVTDAERAVSANSATTGNWSLGQILEHLATANEKTIDGFGFSAPWPIRTVGPFFKKRVLEKGLTPGFNLSSKGPPSLSRERPMRPPASIICASRPSGSSRSKSGRPTRSWAT
jgi:hypothetical protein